MESRNPSPSVQNPSVSFCDRPLTFLSPSMCTIFCTLTFLSQLHEFWYSTLREWCDATLLSHLTPRIWRDFGSALPFQTRLTQTKPFLPLSNEHGSQVKDQGRRQCCHNKHKKFPYRPTHDIYLLSGHTS
jgi:hypothetical protein